MRLNQIKKQIENNIAQKANPLEGLTVNSPDILEFLNSLADDVNIKLSQPDKDSLQITTADSLTYPLASATGQIILQETSLTLTQGENDTLNAILKLTGQLDLATLGNLFITGSLSDPGVGTLALSVDAETLPQLTELAAAMGVGSLSESLQSLGISLPILNKIDLGFELLNKKVTQITALGTMTLGAGSLDMSCDLLPEIVIEGGLQADSQLTLTDLLAPLSLDLSTLPKSQLSALRLMVQADTYQASFELANDWDIDLGGTSLALTTVAGQVETTQTTTAATLSGSVQIGGTTLVMTGTQESDRPVIFTGELAPGDRISLKALVDDLMGNLIDLPDEVPDLDLTDLDLSLTPKTGEFTATAAAMDPWEIPVGFDGLQLDDIALTLNRTLSENGKKTLSGVIGGDLEIAGTSFRCDYSFPGEFVLSGAVPSLKLSPVLQDLCGSSLLRGIPIPTNVLAVDFNNITVTVAPKGKFFTLGASSALGTVELVVKKIANEWGFVVGFLPPTTWKFSSLASELKVLDGLKLDGTSLILSSNDDRTLALTGIDSTLAVNKGLNFAANLDMRGLGVDELLGLEALSVRAAIGGNPADIVLEAAIDGLFDLSDGVAFGDIKFRLQPSPSNFSLTLLGTLTTLIGDSALAFVGGMQVQPRGATLQASMLGLWNEPFDTKGLAIANVALELGVSFPPPLPSIGIAGTLQVGDFSGAVAVKFDSAMPSRSMIAVAFNRLYLMDVISTFCGATVARAIPPALASTVLRIGFEDVNIYIVPQPTSIGELNFDQGFYLAGTLDFWGLRATASLSIDYLEGTELKAEVEPINIGGGIFKVSGAAGRAQPSLYFKLSPNPSTPPVLDLSGAVELLGLRREVQISFSDSGFHFLSSGKIFNLFEATLEVKGSDFDSGGSIWVKASMQNDLLSYLRERATDAIQSAASEATRELSEAQSKVRKAQSTVNALENDINAMRRTVQQERDRDTANIRSARDSVQSAQNKVNAINNDINAMRRTIQQERDRDTANIRSAQNEVSKAQRTVNTLQGEIDSTKRRINSLNQDISNKKRWYDRSGWKKSYRWAEYSGYVTAKRTEIAGLYTKIGGIEAAKATAVGVLEAAKQVLRGIEAGAKTFPIDADPRIIGLFTAKGAATGALETAQLALRGIEAGAKTFPIDADPRIIGLFTAKETANGTLEVAVLVLEGVKKSVGAIADVSQFIADVGLGGLLDVKSAQFEGTLQTTQGGSVAMAMDVVFMKGRPQHLSLNFNFQSPQQAALDLAKQLLPA